MSDETTNDDDDFEADLDEEDGAAEDVSAEDGEGPDEESEGSSKSFVMASETWDTYVDAERFGLRSDQRRVYALITQTFAHDQQELRDYRWYVFGRQVFLLPAVGYYLGYLSLAAVYYCLHWLLGSATDYVLYAFTVLGLLFLYVVRWALQDQDISIAGTEDKENKVFLNRRFSWGRYEDVFDDNQMLIYFMGLWTLLGLQVGLLSFTDGHLGLPIEGGQAECFWITLDNVCHGVFLDICELYDLRLAQEFSHSFWSATVFLFFRLGFNGMLVMAIYQAVRYLRLRQFFRDYPPEAELTPATLSAWVRRLAADERHWAHTYSDEFIFLLMVDEYLQGHDYTVRALHHRFPQIHVTDRARDQFIGRDGEWLLYDFAWPARDDERSEPAADEGQEEPPDEEPAEDGPVEAEIVKENSPSSNG